MNTEKILSKKNKRIALAIFIVVLISVLGIGDIVAKYISDLLKFIIVLLIFLSLLLPLKTKKS